MNDLLALMLAYFLVSVGSALLSMRPNIGYLFDLMTLLYLFIAIGLVLFLINLIQTMPQPLSRDSFVQVGWRALSINLEAVDRLNKRFPGLEVIFVESGGDNLAATFSPELSDLTIYVIDVAAGEKIPRKGGPGITKSDLLVINKIDLAPLVGASLEVMEHDSRRMRGDRPFVFTNLKIGQGLAEIISFIEQAGMLNSARLESSQTP